MISPHDFLLEILTTKNIEGAAYATHDGSWLPRMQQKLEDPCDPFRGHHHTKMYLRDYDQTLRLMWEIPSDADPDAIVYHPLFMPLAELGVDAINKNVVPLPTLCYFLIYFVLEDDDTMTDLRHILTGIINGTGPVHDMLIRVHHIAFMGQEVRAGIRPYGDNISPDFEPITHRQQRGESMDKWRKLGTSRWLLDRVNTVLNT